MTKKVGNIGIAFRKSQEQNKDILCVGTGVKGDGKSNTLMAITFDYVRSFGLVCADCNCQFIYTGTALYANEEGDARIKENLKQNCPDCASSRTGPVTKINFERWLAYDASEVEEKIYSAPQMSIIISDELARFALGENWNSRESRDMKRLLMQCRTKNLIILGALPEFVHLDSKYRNLTDFWIRILQRSDKRALALLLKRSKGEIKDKFHLGLFQELLGDYFEDTPFKELIDRAEKLKSKHPCVEDWFIIHPIEESIYKEYEKYRNEKVFARKSAADEMTVKDLGKIILYNLRTKPEIIKALSEKSPPPISAFMPLVENPLNNKPVIVDKTIYDYICQIEAQVKIVDKKKEEGKK